MKYLCSIFFLVKHSYEGRLFWVSVRGQCLYSKTLHFLIHYCYEYPKVLTKWIFYARNNVTNIIINVCKVETEFEWTCHIVKTHFLLTDVSLLFPYCLQKLFVVTFSVEHTLITSRVRFCEKMSFISYAQILYTCCHTRIIGTCVVKFYDQLLYSMLQFADMALS